MTPDSPLDRSPGGHSITTTDTLKCIGVIAFLVDHIGVFFDPGETWWRLVGRSAAPIFFFLVGFAATRKVPWTWLVLGAGLTVTNGFWFGWPTLNILFSFALLRAAVLPLVEKHVMPRPWLMALLVLGCMISVDGTDLLWEYGTEGWLWAFVGLAHRRALTACEEAAIRMRDALAPAAAVTYIVREIHDYAFGGLQAGILIGMVTLLTFSFIHFRRAAWQVSILEPIPAIMRFCGRSSLEIYALTLFGMQILAYAITRQ